jgi:hypothetical protein|nr:MAG TPA: hypothetical protein [Bacteriophage sp.]
MADLKDILEYLPKLTTEQLDQVYDYIKSLTESKDTSRLSKYLINKTTAKDTLGNLSKVVGQARKHRDNIEENLRYFLSCAPKISDQYFKVKLGSVIDTFHEGLSILIDHADDIEINHESLVLIRGYVDFKLYEHQDYWLGVSDEGYAFRHVDKNIDIYIDKNYLDSYFDHSGNRYYFHQYRLESTIIEQMKDVNRDLGEYIECLDKLMENED